MDVSRILIAGSLSGVLVLALSPSAHAVAPETFQERGRTVRITDGDTVWVDVFGDGRRSPKSVRFTGVNANEVGRCHAGSATSLTRRLALGHRTRLYAINIIASMSRMRILRTIRTQQNGGYTNLARRLIEASLANVSPKFDEWAHNREYRLLADRVAARGRGIWDKDACGRGPQQGASIGLSVRWNAPGDDRRNLNGEWASITNNNNRVPLNLSGWYLRDASPYRYVFPRGTVVPAGETLRLRSGCGRRSGLTHYWCSEAPRWLNASFDRRHLGDGAYLVDPHHDIRKRFLYPDMT